MNNNSIKKKIKIKKKYSPKVDDIVLVKIAQGKYTKAKVLNIQDKYVKVKYIEKKIIAQIGKKEELIQLKNIKELDTKVYVQNRNEISPEEWIQLDQKRFISWINEVFLPYKIKDIENKPNNNKKFDFRPNQKFIRDYLSHDSPYRGILLYHGLGSGKTCTSIAVAENLKSDKNILVMLPASLRSNYVKALINDCGAAYKNKEDKISDKYTFVSYNASNTLDQLNKISSLDNHVIVIDEVHNLISMMVSKSKKGPEIYKKLMEAKNCKIVALSGTPIINFPFEVSKLANILRGYIQLSVFYVQAVEKNYGKIWELESLKNKLMSLPNVDYVDVQERYLYIQLSTKTYDFGHSDLIKDILDKSKDMGVNLKYIETKDFTLFPEDEDEFRNYFINEYLGTESLKNNDLLKRRLTGLISYYRGGKPIYYPKLNPIQFFDVPMSDYQFRDYELVRDVEREKEKSSSLKKIAQSLSNSKSKGSTVKKANSLFRVFSREFSNFTFPEDIERPFVQKFIKSSKKKKKKNELSAEELKLLKKENDIQNGNSNIEKKDKKLIDEALEKLSKKKNEYLVDTPTGLQKYSPKMAKMLENINKSEGLVFIYSAFRALEGIGVFSLVLEANGYDKFDYKSKNNSNKPRFAVWSGSEDQDEREKILKLFNSSNNKYGEKIKILLATSAGAEGIDLKNIRQIHIMEPYWHEVRINQVIGRGNRLKSHIELPEKDRVLDVFRYNSVYSDSQKKIAKEKETTDEYIFEIAKKKLVVTEEIKKIMKEVAVDCVLNAEDNEKNISCFSYGVDAEGLGYKTDIKDDFVYGKTELGTKSVKRKLIPMLLDSSKRVLRANKKLKKFCYYFDKECKSPIEKLNKNLKRIAVDEKTNEIFDISSAKLNNPVKIGDIDDKGIMV